MDAAGAGGASKKGKRRAEDEIRRHDAIEEDTENGVGADELEADGEFADGNVGLNADGARDLGTIKYGEGVGDDDEDDDEEFDEDDEEDDDEDEMDESDDDNEQDNAADASAGAGAGAGAATKKKNKEKSARDVWRAGVDALGEGEELDFDPTAYQMYHSMGSEWPCLSFDVVPDRMGPARTKFPLTAYLVAGTQADKPSNNRLMVMRMGNLTKTQEKGDDSDDEDGFGMGSDDDEDEQDPVVDVMKIPHQGGVNRVRTMHQEPHVVSTWSDTGKVHLWDVRALLRQLEANASDGGGGSKDKAAAAASSNTGAGIAKAMTPIVTWAGHGTEGYAMDWSPVAPGRLATGDCNGKIFVWDVDAAAAASAMGAGAGGAASSSSAAADLGSVWQVDGAQPYTYPGCAGCSVEDIQWSPNEAGVFASCGTDKHVRIWDTRARNRSMLAVPAHDCDVNVISWSRLVSYLLVSGGDDGTFKIWDLRNFKRCVLPVLFLVVLFKHILSSLLDPMASPGPHCASPCMLPLRRPRSTSPIAHFKWHRGPITSIEWAPDDENALCVASSDNSVTLWDMSLEEDDEAELAFAASKGEAGAVPSSKDPRLADVPPQLLFVHQGQNDNKEAHFHRQLPGVVFSTAEDGFNVWKPDVLTTT